MSLHTDEVRSAFSSAGLHNVNQDILSKCVSLASTLHISPAQMAESWEAFSLNKNVTELTDHTFQSYRNVLMKDADTLSSSNGEAPAVVVSRPGLGKRQVGTKPADSFPMVTPPPKRLHGNEGVQNASSAVDAVATGVSMSPTGGAVVTPHQSAVAANLPKYNERTGVGKVVVTFNPHDLPATTSTETDSSSFPRCIVSDSFPTNVQEPYRHMFTTLEERAKALDDHLVTMGEEIVERYGIDRDNEDENGIAPLEAVGVPRQEKVCCVGRVCNEAHEGRINQTSVLLEGSRHFSGGTRVNLDLSQLKSSKTSFSLFPGQIVAVEGLNTSGRKMVANRICEGAAHQPTKTAVEDLMRFHHSDEYQGGKPLKLMSMCGPYTTSDNIEYAPLLDLMEVVRTEKPDVVIMAGPFVDTRQPLVNNGEMFLESEDGGKVSVTYEAFFANKIAGLIEDLFETEGEGFPTQFVLVPSLDDSVAEWVYPQAPLEDRLPGGGKHVKLPNANGMEFGTLGLHYIETAGREGRVSRDTPRRVHRVSNPCTIKVNEVVIGLTSTDTLFHINTDETSANLEPGSRLGRIAQHLVQQRSYYPLFPPPASDKMATNLDLKHIDQWCMPCQPDVLIVPSKLTCFARTVLESTVVINPGQLSRGTTGGTYTVMDIHPIKRETLETAGGTDVEMEHGIQDRVRVEIKRI